MKRFVIIASSIAIWAAVAWLPARSLPSNTPEIQGFFNRLPALPSQSMQTIYANLIGGMKSAGITDKCPVAYDFATFDAGSSLLNLNSANYKATPVQITSLPVFTVNNGWAGGGVNSYINSNYNPTVASDGFYTLNAALVWWYSSQATSTSSQPWLGDFNPGVGGPTTMVFWNNANGSVDWGINGATKNLASTPKDGFFIMKRVSSGSSILKRNDIQIDSSTAVSTSIPNNSFGAPYGVTLSFFGVCGLLSAAQETTLSTLVTAAAHAVGL